MPQASDLERYYNDGYFSQYHGDRWKQWNIKHHFTRKYELLETYRSPGRLLDIGCADGLFLNGAQKRGWQVEGAEISHELAAGAKTDYGIKVHVGSFTSLDLEENRYDAVTMIHCLEHCPEPESVLNKVNSILNEDGLAYIAVPNLDKRMQAFISTTIVNKRIRQKLLKIAGGVCPPDHIYTFSRSTLSGLVEKSGFEVVEYRYVNNIRPLFMESFKVWVLLRMLGFVSKVMSTGLHLEMVVRKCRRNADNHSR
jgi:2-polyprenyl-3-methyl-5-hydroxy-6-metoxy-1,4-benzoquinol methylase